MVYINKINVSICSYTGPRFITYQ